MKIDIEKIKEEKSIKELLEFGIINIDKPSGPTSFTVSEFICKTLGLRKTSHFGTLDPKVTGVLPVALNRACKLSRYFLGEDKTYVGIAQFHKDIELDKIIKAIQEKFLGKIIQTPPVKSRVKREPRPRKIYSFELLEKEGINVLFKVKCEGGTYIRKLIDDLGHELGVGAHMLELRRTNAGIFFEDDSNYPSINLYDFESAIAEYLGGNSSKLKKIIIPAEIISKIFPSIEIYEKDKEKILHGIPIKKENSKEDFSKLSDDKFCIFSKDQFIGVFKKTKEKELILRSEFTLQPIKGK